MASVNNKNLSDEDWLVSRARTCMKTDQYAAKAWMITARTLFPQNFSIQFEAYNLEKMGKNVKEAAKLLEEMFLIFPNENRLWTEVQSILGALQSDTVDNRNSFLTEIFAAISTHSQCQMLLHVADKISDTLEQCRLLLLAMRKFSSLVSEHGLKLIDKLQKAEHGAKFMTPINCYRKLLICDVLPLILEKTNKLDVPPKQLYKWLQQAIEFYVLFVTQTPSHGNGTPPSPDMMSPSKKGKRFVLIAGLYDRESQIADPWGLLLSLLVHIGQHLGWDIDKNLFTQTRELQWQHVLNVYNRTKQVQDNRQILYLATVLFLECLYTYVSSVDPEAFMGSLNTVGPLVLIEGLKLDPGEITSPSKSKKAKKTNAATQIVSPPSVPDSQRSVQSFLTAFKCYELLHSKTDLQKEFMGLCEVWRMGTWTWMAHFQTDMLIYQGAYTDALVHLQSYTPSHTDNMKVRNTLQMACCFYCIEKYNRACELVLDVISQLPSSHHPDKSNITQSEAVDGTGRHLVLTLCTEEEIMPYCIQLLLSCFKEKALSLKSNDTSLGHMLVLLQYDWPKQEPLFQQVLKKIKSQGSFTYNSFFSYVINIDILEEFAFLKTVEGGKVNLDILPVSTKALSQQRTVTRGVNKFVKEDFKHTMEKQVARSDENIDTVVRSFLNEEKTFILQGL